MHDASLGSSGFPGSEALTLDQAYKVMAWLGEQTSAGRWLAPTARRRSEMRARFDRIFLRTTGFVMLDRLLERPHANKAELLMVLDHPAIPLHINGSENDIRCHVTKRQVSGGTKTDIGRDCRDAFLGLGNTHQKLGVAFWSYLGARIGVAGAPAMPRLADLIRCRGQPA